MTRIAICAALAAASVLSVGSALADEIIIRRNAPGNIDVPPPPRDVVIERRRPDCSTTTVHRENGLGDSTTTTRRDCD